jgi:hypothetical protein
MFSSKENPNMLCWGQGFFNIKKKQNFDDVHRETILLCPVPFRDNDELLLLSN